MKKYTSMKKVMFGCIIGCIGFISNVYAHTTPTLVSVLYKRSVLIGEEQPVVFTKILRADPKKALGRLVLTIREYPDDEALVYTEIIGFRYSNGKTRLLKNILVPKPHPDAHLAELPLKDTDSPVFKK